MSKFVKLAVIILNIVVITLIVNHHQKYNNLKNKIFWREGEIISDIGSSMVCKAKERESYNSNAFKLD